MFDVLMQGFESAKLALQGKQKLNEENLAPALREVRNALLQADVGLDVTKRFLEGVKERALGKVVRVKTPGGAFRPMTSKDHFIHACYEELVNLMGPVDTALHLDGDPAVVLMIGLQGAGKTTAAVKIARYLKSEGRRPLLVAADIYRPAAVDQLQVLGKSEGIPVYAEAGVNPVTLAQRGVGRARQLGCDVLIIDTAGRLAIDDHLMGELESIKAAVRPQNVLFVCDAMMGQDAVRTAKEFDQRLDFTGFVLTKMDGDARGGAALSIKEVTGKPIKFLGTGEKPSQLEVFRPEGLAQRILGFGDVVGLVQDFEQHVDRETAEQDAKKMLKGQFTYDDFVKQMKVIQQMGSMKDLMARIPMMSGMMKQIPEEALDDRELDRTLAIISSMTPQERTHTRLLNDSRFQRIARGSGRPLEDVVALHTRFQQAQKMMQGMGSMMKNPAAMKRMQQSMEGGGGLGAMMGGLEGGLGPPPKPALSKEEKMARRKKQKAARKARKRQRK